MNDSPLGKIENAVEEFVEELLEKKPAPETPAAPPPSIVKGATMAFDNAPEWFQFALHEIGTREVPPNRGPAIQRYIDLAECGAQGDPWCAIFANAMFALAHVPGTRSASSQSFAHSKDFVAIPKPCLGAIAVFWRGSGPGSGIGHVGFYRGEAGASVYTLGGNEGDMVQIEPFPKKSASFGLEGYFWPASIPVPTDQLAPILMPGNTPPHEMDPDKVT